MHRFLYNDIHIGNASQLIKNLPRYDIIFLGDVIEHFTLEEGMQFLHDALERANQAVVISTPKFETEQDDLCGNELERHRSLWGEEDFKKFPGAEVKTIDEGTLLAVLTKPGVTPPKLTPPPTQSAEAMHAFQQAKRELAAQIPADEAFVLVDQDQLRALLPHQRALPFLEKNGEYWGPPADGTEAVRELERMHVAGASRIAFIESTLWWLEHYPELREHLLHHAEVTHQTAATRIYRLKGQAAGSGMGEISPRPFP
jgi:hypothetical protein